MRSRSNRPPPGPRAPDAVALLAAYAAAHEDGRAGAGWSPLAALFAVDGVLRFEGIAAGPYVGREAIRDAFEARGPTDRLLVGAPRATGAGRASASYRWAARPREDAGVLEATAVAGRLAELVVRAR
jgi:hypothetical protein